MLKIGLTGGIACGKTTVSHFFKQLGIPIIDTDIIAHELTAMNTSCYHKIINHFGEKMVNPDNSLNRRLLRQIIFSNKAEKEWLESFLHPLIYKEIQERVSLLDTPYCLLVIPLLLEKQWTNSVDRILVIDIPEDIQIQRIQARDKVSAMDAQLILQNQLSRKKRLEAANDIISNNNDMIALEKKVKKLHQFYLKLATKNKT
ncbi:MAG: Dephospho-CoA kinase [Legionellaceae bacterium]